MMRFAAIAVGLLAIGMVPAHSAPDFPTRTVHFVVPFTAGGANDSVARAMADRLSKKWRQPVVVENRPGGGTTIGTRAVIEAPPDGHTLLFTSSTPLVVSPHTTAVPFNPLVDLQPVILAVSISPTIAVGNETGVRTLPELIARARSNPGKMTYASAGTGTYSHVAMEYLARRAGIDMLHVPYAGTSQAITDMLGGRIDSYMVALAVFKDLAEAGKLRILAVGTEERNPLLPNIPTIAETVPGYGIDVWFGFAAPAKTPPELLDRIHGDMADILRDEEFIRSIVRPQGFSVRPMSRAAFVDQVTADYKRWGEMVEAVGLKLKNR